MSVKGFKIPSKAIIRARTSTITNAFVQSIIPVREPQDAEIMEVLRILEMEPDHVTCAYCGSPAVSTWDHFFPLVVDKLPTGYITEIYNLVPCCSSCNSSKGSKNWELWILNRFPESTERNRRIQHLSAYEHWGDNRRTKIDFVSLVHADDWRTYWDKRAELFKKMEEAQSLANQILSTVINAR